MEGKLSDYFESMLLKTDLESAETLLEQNEKAIKALGIKIGVDKTPKIKVEEKICMLSLPIIGGIVSAFISPYTFHKFLHNAVLSTGCLTAGFSYVEAKGLIRRKKNKENHTKKDTIKYNELLEKEEQLKERRDKLSLQMKDYKSQKKKMKKR